MAQSVERLAMGWTVQGSKAGGSEIFHNRPDRPWGPSSLLYNGYQILAGVHGAEAWCWPLTPSNAEIKERLEL